MGWYWHSADGSAGGFGRGHERRWIWNCAQYIKAHHVAETFPNAVEWHFAVEARHYTFFDVTIAAEHIFHRWLFDEVFAECNAMVRVMHRLGDSYARCAERQNFDRKG
jgi:hypothetical protein